MGRVDLGKGLEAARLDVGFFFAWLKNRQLVQKGTFLHGLHGLEASSVVLPLIFAGTLLMTQTY